MADEQPNRRPRGHRKGGFRNDNPDQDQRPQRTEAPKGKFIRKDDRAEGRDGRRGRGGRKFEKRRDDRDLDRELRDYWITQRGGEKNEDVKELAREKLNSQMEAYWKQRQEEADKAAQ